MTTNSHSNPQGLVTPHSYPCTYFPKQKVQTWLPQLPSTSSGKFLLNPCVTNSQQEDNDLVLMIKANENLEI